MPAANLIVALESYVTLGGCAIAADFIGSSRAYGWQQNYQNHPNNAKLRTLWQCATGVLQRSIPCPNALSARGPQFPDCTAAQYYIQ